MRILHLFWVLFSFALPVGTASGQFTERLRLGISSDPSVPLAGGPTILAMMRKGTYWKEGALLVGVPAAVATYFFVQGSTDETGNAILDGLILGAVGAALGGLMGSFFPKSNDDRQSARRVEWKSPTGSEVPSAGWRGPEGAAPPDGWRWVPG